MCRRRVLLCSACASKRTWAFYFNVVTLVSAMTAREIIGFHALPRFHRRRKLQNLLTKGQCGYIISLPDIRGRKLSEGKVKRSQ